MLTDNVAPLATATADAPIAPGTTDRMPPLTFVAPANELVVPVSVSVPFPILVNPSPAVPLVMAPLKVPAPTVRVAGFVAWELVTVPAPLRVPSWTPTPSTCRMSPVLTTQVALALPAEAEVSRETRPAVPPIVIVPE